MELKFICVILLITLFANGQAQVRIDIPEPFGDNFIESELIQDVAYVPLKVQKPNMITPDMEMKSDGEYFFILDHKDAKSVYRFDGEGTLMNTISDTKIEGNTMQDLNLSSPVKFSLNAYSKQVELYNFEKAKINRYNYDGSFQGQCTPEVNPSDFIRDKKGNYWIYTGWNNKLTQYRLLKTDLNGKTLERKMRLISKCVQTEGFAFYPTDKGICMWESLGNSTYFINGDEIKETYRFDFGSRNLMANYHEIDPFEAYKVISESGYFTVKKYLENDRWAYFFLNFISNRSKSMFHVIYKKESEQTFIYSENSSIGAFDKAHLITENDELVFLVLPRKMRQLLRSGVEFIPAPFASLDGEIANMRDPIVLKIKLGNTADNQENIDESGEGY